MDETQLEVADQQKTIAALLARSGRDHVPIRRNFVQQRRRGGGASSLAAFVRSRRSGAFDLYLLAHAVASAPPFDVVLPSAVWARALGLSGKGTASAVSRHWTWLEQQKLITSQRRGRLREIRLLREDGSGAPYRHPGSEEGDYFKLPYVYWESAFHNRLGLPAKAVLLIALSLQESFVLPMNRGARWYGLSRDTVQRGLADLLRIGVLRYRRSYEPAPLSPLGYVAVRHYRLFPPFSRIAPSERDDWATRPTRVESATPDGRRSG